MVLIDDFESQFRRASKAVYSYEPLSLKKIVFVLDGEPEERNSYIEPISAFLKGALMIQSAAEDITWEVLSFEPNENVTELIERANASNPDLIVTRRHLFKQPRGPLQSLGIYVDVLAQSTSALVLIIPRLTADELQKRCQNTSDVMVLSDSLSEDNQLVNTGVLFTQPDGCLYLTDVEDGAAFDRYMDVIEKIPLIDSVMAREEIHHQLEKEVREFSEQCIEKIRPVRSDLRIESVFRYGSSIADFRTLISDYKTDLLILNTNDASQMAMHGIAYSIAVEFTDFPLLLI